ncbi:MAG TPA: hypothetical protein VGX94_13200 [Terriglobia bacterium]|nr:hypothetical protein [Terriglobia bacterium]
MPAYQKLQKFMDLVRAANPTFEKRIKSSLRPLINILNDATGNAQKVRTALMAISSVKANKYKKALNYLLRTYPDLAQYAASVNFSPLDKLNAAEFTRVDLPGDFDPGPPKFDRIVTKSKFLGMTVEQFLLANADAGVILIHLSGHDKGMDLIFGGETCLNHIKSVLHVARKMGRDVCCLYMEEPPVLPALEEELGGIKNKVMVLEKRQHMGVRQKAFLEFAQKHDHVVVMGFDATICVEANLFGAPDKMDDGSLAPPLITITNVVTSRPVLVCTGTIFPKKDKGQWGCLYNT